MKYAGQRPQDTIPDASWKRVDPFEVLGHFISASCSIAQPWGEVRRSIMKAYYAKFRPGVLRHCNTDDVLALMDRHLLPVLTFRCCTWPFTMTIAKEIDSLQARLMAPLLAVTPDQDEDIGEFVRRRNRRANTLCDDHGRWSHIWAQRVMSFDAHIGRNTSGQLWPAHLRFVRDSHWLMERRALFLPRTCSQLQGWTVFAGRTNTRRARGGVPTRWHDGILESKQYLDDVRLTRRLKSRRERDRNLRQRVM